MMPKDLLEHLETGNRSDLFLKEGTQNQTDIAGDSLAGQPLTAQNIREAVERIRQFQTDPIYQQRAYNEQMRRAQQQLADPINMSTGVGHIYRVTSR